MTMKRVCGINGFDISQSNNELNEQIKATEKQILSFYTDPFMFRMETSIGPDAKITIHPQEGKVIVKELQSLPIGFYSKDNYTRTQWRSWVLQSALAVIQKEYGNVPLKEAKEVIHLIKAKTKQRNAAVINKQNLLSHINHIPAPLGKELMIEFVERMPVKKNLYEVLRNIFAEYGLPDIKKLGITINGLFPFSRNTVKVENYVEAIIVDGNKFYFTLYPVFTLDGNRYILRLEKIV